MSDGFTQWLRRSIERLKTQPHEIKSHVAFVVALSITSIVALVWATTLPARFETIDGTGVADVRRGAEEAKSLLEHVKEQVPTTKRTNDSSLRAGTVRDTTHVHDTAPSGSVDVGTPLNERIDALMKQIATTTDTRTTEKYAQPIPSGTAPTLVDEPQTQTTVQPSDDAAGVGKSTATSTSELYDAPPGTVPILIETRP
jgi:hypothetical protein